MFCLISSLGFFKNIFLVLRRWKPEPDKKQLSALETNDEKIYLTGMSFSLFIHCVLSVHKRKNVAWMRPCYPFALCTSFPRCKHVGRFRENNSFLRWHSVGGQEGRKWSRLWLLLMRRMRVGGYKELLCSLLCTPQKDQRQSHYQKWGGEEAGPWVTPTHSALATWVEGCTIQCNPLVPHGAS